MTLTNDDIAALNRAKIGEVVTLEDGRVVQADHGWSCCNCAFDSGNFKACPFLSACCATLRNDGLPRMFKEVSDGE